MRWLQVGVLPLLLTSLWMWLASLSRTAPTLRNQRIGLLIAHPDDEVMFFAPTLLALTEPSLGNHVQILCMSTGDADGLGHIRKQELIDSALRLGIRSPADVHVLDHPDFPDSMTIDWDPDRVAHAVATAFASEGSAPAPDTPSHLSLDTLITFDSTGVSSHPNHRACHAGARTLLGTLARAERSVMLYTLTSVNVARKYASVLEAPWTLLTGGREALVFVSGPSAYWRARGAMVGAHRSQMRWFRYGWITLSRYMVVNDLREVEGV